MENRFRLSGLFIAIVMGIGLLLAGQGALAGILPVLAYFAIEIVYGKNEKYLTGLFIIAIACKMLIDLTWSMPLGSVFNVTLTPNRLYANISIILLITVLLLREKMLNTRAGLYLMLGIAASYLINMNGAGLEETVRFLSAIAFIFIGYVFIRETSDMVKLIRLMVALSVIPSTLALLQLAGRYPYYNWDVVMGRWMGRTSGGYEVPMALVSYMLYIVPFVLFMIDYARSRTMKAIYCFYLLILGAIVFTTFHRMSYVVMFIQIALWLVLTKKIRLLLLVSAGLCLVISVQGKILEDIYWSITSVFSHKLTFEQGFRGRGGIWISYLKSFTELPVLHILFGKGDSSAYVTTLKAVMYEPHSDYIRILYHYGVFTFLLYVYFLCHLAAISFRAIKMNAETTFNKLGMLNLIFVVSIFLYSVSLEPTRYPAYLWYVMVFSSFLLFSMKRVPQPNDHG